MDIDAQAACYSSTPGEWQCKNVKQAACGGSQMLLVSYCIYVVLLSAQWGGPSGIEA